MTEAQAANIIDAGYMIQDIQGNAIYGIGNTAQEAWAEVKDGAGPFFDAYDKELDDETAYTTLFKTYGATQALMDEVKRRGGNIAWGIVGGVACTREEEEAAH